MASVAELTLSATESLASAPSPDDRPLSSPSRPRNLAPTKFLTEHSMHCAKPAQTSSNEENLSSTRPKVALTLPITSSSTDGATRVFTGWVSTNFFAAATALARTLSTVASNFPAPSPKAAPFSSLRNMPRYWDWSFSTQGTSSSSMPVGGVRCASSWRTVG